MIPNLVIFSAVALTAVGVTSAVTLVLSSRKLSAKESPLEDKILEILPGRNCGACGYIGCQQLAKRCVELKDKEACAELASSCRLGGREVAEAIGEVLGVEVHAAEKRFPVVLCKGGNNCSDRLRYLGLEDCRAAMLISEGQKTCQFGCLGYGSCAKACPVNAITIDENRTPVIDKEICLGCGICVKTCPKNIIRFEKPNERVTVLCSSRGVVPGRKVREYCKVGCIACGVCKKVCPVGAATVSAQLAEIDPEICKVCGECVEKCPMNTIEYLPENPETQPSGLPVETPSGHCH